MINDIWFDKNKLYFSNNFHISWEKKAYNYAYASDWTTVDFTKNQTAWIYNELEEVDTIYCGSNRNEFQIWNFDLENYKNTQVIDSYQKFDFNDPFILLYGHTGSGTSILVKFLRHIGIHFGDDCGNIDIRKPMESSSLRVWWWFVESDHTIEEKQKSFQSILGSYNYKKNKINSFKLLNDKPTNQVLKFCNIIPNTKVISVIKKPSKKTTLNTTKEGASFNMKNELDVNKIQYPTLEGNPIFHLDWNKFFTEYEYCNKLLKYIGSDFRFEDQESFRTFTLSKVGFNPKYL